MFSLSVLEVAHLSKGRQVSFPAQIATTTLQKVAALIERERGGRKRKRERETNTKREDNHSSLMNRMQWIGSLLAASIIKKRSIKRRRKRL